MSSTSARPSGTTATTARIDGYTLVDVGCDLAARSAPRHAIGAQSLQPGVLFRRRQRIGRPWSAAAGAPEHDDSRALSTSNDDLEAGSIRTRQAVADLRPQVAGCGALGHFPDLVRLRDRDDVLELPWHQRRGPVAACADARSRTDHRVARTGVRRAQPRSEVPRKCA